MAKTGVVTEEFQQVVADAENKKARGRTSKESSKTAASSDGTKSSRKSKKAESQPDGQPEPINTPEENTPDVGPVETDPNGQGNLPTVEPIRDRKLEAHAKAYKELTEEYSALSKRVDKQKQKILNYLETQGVQVTPENPWYYKLGEYRIKLTAEDPKTKLEIKFVEKKADEVF